MVLCSAAAHCDREEVSTGKDIRWNRSTQRGQKDMHLSAPVPLFHYQKAFLALSVIVMKQLLPSTQLLVLSGQTHTSSAGSRDPHSELTSQSMYLVKSQALSLVLIDIGCAVFLCEPASLVEKLLFLLDNCPSLSLPGATNVPEARFCSVIV